MLKDFFDAILANARPETVQANGITYVRSGYTDPRQPEPKAEPLVFRTLDSLIGFLEASPSIDLVFGDDEFCAGPEQLFVHVVDPCHVQVVGPVRDRWHDRECVAEARIERSWSAKESWRGAHDRAIVELRSCFEETEHRNQLVAALGNIKGGTEVRAEDDGFSQQVAVTSGLRAAWETLPNPAMLSPFRTFHEVNQPASPFVVRLNGGGESPIEVSLHLADAGNWELQAVRQVRAYLESALEDWVVLA